MGKRIEIKNWKLAFAENAEVVKKEIYPSTPDEVKAFGLKVINATVPGNYEIDFMREGLLPDVYMGANSVKTQALENLHLYYFTEFDYHREEGFDGYLVFNGIDTVAEIMLDGDEAAFVENCFHAHEISLSGVKDGRHTLLVHIIPSAIYARAFDLPATAFGLKYQNDSIMLRKPQSMFGWDIMPRIVSGGLWKQVEIKYLPKSRIKDPFTITNNLWDNKAELYTSLKIETEEDFITDFTIEMQGKCGNSTFNRTFKPYSANVRLYNIVEDPKLWYPKNYGEQNLYDITIKLLFKGRAVDEYSYRIGIRQVKLSRTSRAGDDGDFCFIINGKRIFALGTNWVPCDALPSRHDDYTLRNIKLADDAGCNMIRCWGGNVYPSELLYDYCDEHGIMIWQDFALACGHYPDDDRLSALVREEVKRIVIEKRNHPALVVWAGDNECDSFVSRGYDGKRDTSDPLKMLDPNLNKLTRDIILREVREHDISRPYLPSSPYIDETTFLFGNPAEDHLWGPRDFFKGKYYGTAKCHFASEIGYHGCPSPKSLEKFIPEESMPKEKIEEIYSNADWLVHAAGMETETEDNPYAYRLPLMVSQVDRIFGSHADNISDYARQSQISQAEAKKFFIEMFRAQKPQKTGILWWNIVDGWPQISDAVVDWYGTKKLAYSFIKRSQAPFLIACAEPDKDGLLPLFATNDGLKDVSVKYKVTNLADGKLLAEGELKMNIGDNEVIARLPQVKGGFYLIEWTGSENGSNHFVVDIGSGIELETYLGYLEKAGYLEAFEGF